jgi:hypothetical protein
MLIKSLDDIYKLKQEHSDKLALREHRSAPDHV